MILRRLADAIREQNWLTVVLEVFIVVFGILIGLQLDDWNERRKDRADEHAFVARLHDDLLLADTRANRVRERRLDLFAHLSAGADVIFDRAERNSLTSDECSAIGDSRFFNIIISNLPSLTELVGAGRLDIIQDSELRLAIVKLQLRIEALKELIPLQTLVRVDVPVEYPDLIQTSSYFDRQLNEYQQRYQCDLQGMRTSAAFKSALSLSVDVYDAYLRDGLIPWMEQFDEVHRLLDRRLGIDHSADEQGS
jgi:hypothetical protein